MNDKPGMKRLDLGPTGVRVAQNVKRQRNRLNLTYSALEKQLDAGGHKIPALGLRRIEAEARKVDVDDLVALAIAFDVSPLTLLLPPEGDRENVSALTGLQEPIAANVQWIWATGEEPLFVPDIPNAPGGSPANDRAIQMFQLVAKPEVQHRDVTGIGEREDGETRHDYFTRLAKQGTAHVRTQGVRFDG